MVGGAAGHRGFCYWRLGGSDFEWQRFRTTFTHLHPGWLSLGIALVLLTYVGRALRWQVMMRPFAPHSRFHKILSATVIGFTGIVILGRPGELIRPYLIAAREGTSFSAQMAIWILGAHLGSLLVLVIFGFALTQVQIASGDSRAGNAVAAPDGRRRGCGALHWFVSAMLLMISIFSEAAQRRIRDAMPAIPERFRGRIENILVSFAGGMQASRSGLFTAQILAYSIAEWAIIVGATWCLLRSFPQTSTFSVVDSAVFIGFVAFGSIVQIPGIGGGMQVASVVILTELFGVDFAAATGVAIADLAHDVRVCSSDWGLAGGA